MKAILRSYFYRLFRDKLFYISVGIVFVLGLLIGIGFRAVQSSSDSNQPYFAYGLLIGLNGGDFLGGGTVPWIDLLFFTVFGAIRYRKETVSGAMRNYIVSGYSRKQIFHSLYLGNLVYYLFTLLALCLGSCLPYLGTPFGIAGDQIGTYFGVCGLSLLTSLAFMTFAYFTFVLLQGHGFSGSMAIIIYAVLSLFGTIMILVVSLNLETVDPGLAKVLFVIDGILPPGNRSALASALTGGGNVSLGAVPGGLYLSAFPEALPSGSHTYEVIAAIRSLNWEAINIATSIVFSVVIGVGSYLLGFFINNKRDLK